MLLYIKNNIFNGQTFLISILIWFLSTINKINLINEIFLIVV